MENVHLLSRCGQCLSVAFSSVGGSWAGKQVSVVWFGFDLLLCRHFAEHPPSHRLVLFCGQRE